VIRSFLPYVVSIDFWPYKIKVKFKHKWYVTLEGYASILGFFNIMIENIRLSWLNIHLGFIYEIKINNVNITYFLTSKSSRIDQRPNTGGSYRRMTDVMGKGSDHFRFTHVISLCRRLYSDIYVRITCGHKYSCHNIHYYLNAGYRSIARDQI